MITTRLVYDWLYTYKMIGAHPDHMALRARVDARLAALKQKGKLYESPDERVSRTAEATCAGLSATAAAGTSGQSDVVDNWGTSH